MTAGNIERYQDEGDAAARLWSRIRQIQAERHEAPAVVRVRELRGKIGTGPASDDYTVSVWVNDRLHVVFNVFRDIRNYAVLLETPVLK